VGAGLSCCVSKVREPNVVEFSPPPLTAAAEVALPLTTVNILSYNRREELHVTLQKLVSSLEYPSDRLEIIVVDNLSTDGSREMVRKEFPDVQLVENSANVGIAGWNEGFDRGRGEFFLVLDDDCYIEGASLKLAVAAALATSADLVSFNIANPNETGFLFNRHVNPGLLSFWGCAALISRRAIVQIGGFDAAIFVYMHELEFTIRLLDRGLSHLFLPDVRAFHMKPAGTAKRSSEMAMQRCAFNRGYILSKLFPARQLFAQVGWTFLGYARFGVRAPSIALKQSASFVRGLSVGRRHRAMVSRETAKFYSRCYKEFGPPNLALGNHRVEIDKRYYAERSQFYPSEKSALLKLVPSGS